MRVDLHAHVEHDPLPGRLQQPGLGELEAEADATQDREVPERDPVDAGQVAGRDVAVDRLLHQVGLRQLQHRVGDDRRQRQRRLQPVGTQVSQQAPHQARVVRFSDYVVVVGGHIEVRG